MARLDEKEFAAAARRANEVYDVQEEPAARDPGDASAKRRRKKKGKKKHTSNATPTDRPTGSRLPPVRGVTGYTDSYIATGQTDPPSIPIRQLFAAENAYPEGEKQDYAEDFVLQRSSQAELRAQMRDDEDFMLQSLRQAAEVHRHVRKFAQSLMKPGVSLFELCCRLEDKNRELVEEAGPQRGIAFPTGCSLNHVAAHYTPNTVADKTVLSYNDVMKLDIGTHVNGYTVDSAFTVAFNPQYDELLEAVKAATNEGVRSAGVDVQLGELGGAIQEVMESYEVTINGKTYPVKAIRNLCGHTIEKGRVHGDKSVSSIKTGSTVKMEEGEIYAIETFGSTGRGYVDSDGECSHYARNMEAAHVPIESARTKKLLAHLTRTFGSMPFCRRWLELPSGGSAFVNPKGAKQERYLMALRELVNKGIVNAYPPLVDIRGSYTAQYEHTLVLRSMGKEVMSRGDDY